MSRSAALESSLAVAAVGAALALAIDAPSHGWPGRVVEVSGWLLLAAGVWGFMLALLVGTRATTAISTTHLDRPAHYRRHPVPAPVANRPRSTHTARSTPPARPPHTARSPQSARRTHAGRR
jgi:hypothetical protein